MDKQNLYVILVVYNKHLTDSPSFNSVINRGYSVIICDNSTKDMENESVVLNNHCTYLSMYGNLGLSKAYNKAIDFIQKSNLEMEGRVILLDDDTVLPEEYFEKCLENNDFDIYFPIVRDENGILSPCEMADDIPKRVSCIHSIKEISAINSGMCISLSCFKDYRYDERYFLDYIDHAFIRDMKKKNKCFGLMDVTLYQNFSDVVNTKESAKNRLNIFLKDIHIYYENNLWKYVYLKCKRKLKLCIKYRDISFLI